MAEKEKKSGQRAFVTQDGFVVYRLGEPERGVEVAKKFKMEWDELRLLNKVPGAATVHAPSRSIHPDGGSIRFRPLICTYAPCTPHGAYV